MEEMELLEEQFNNCDGARIFIGYDHQQDLHLLLLEPERDSENPVSIWVDEALKNKLVQALNKKS
ncbi:hypothetical protein [Listeria ilorinensis]|uniref:hypothetical protein n=1 Tax=Listeria ilorinensis TaxID=2867439 RepID=UPI001EF75082|nr:hypothetical protein [Listeria ilorinensis]